MKAKQVLNELGLHECNNAPCIFRGYVQGHHNKDEEIIQGLYVDDFIYFSSSKSAEALFEKLLSEKLNVEFYPNPT